MAATATKVAPKSLARILMCRPTHFRVEYSINPWMNPADKVDKEKAMNQWNNLKATIEKSGAIVDVLEPTGASHLPDMVFTANAAVVRGKKAYLANFHYEERKGERHFYEKWLRSHGFETLGSVDFPFEGAGDALWAGKNQNKLFCGVGPRTDPRALSDLAENLKNENPFKVLGVRLIDPRFYHIDTCFCPLEEGLAIWFPAAFDQVAQHNMKNEIELVPVSEKDAKQFSCNAVVVGKTVILNKGADDTGKMLQKLGYTPEFVDMSEFIKSGGSAKCCTLALPM
uniref:Amidinotransferase n=1 Tax=Acrobeloides nanus TaxID=290746 RepID=A0A914DCX6_9BILA